jgi:hypothetical protein
MRNITKALRTAYYTALNGVISVPVVDSWNTANGMVDDHVIIKNISQAKKDNTFQTFGEEVIVELDIVTYQKNGFTSDTRDDIEDEILQILKPDVQTDGITIGTFGLYNVEKESSNDVEEIVPGGNIARKILRIKQDVHQN